MQLKLQTRILLLFILLIVIFISGGLFLIRNLDSREKLFRHNELNELRSFHEKIVRLQSNKVESFVLDYTFWDDMVRFIRSRDSAWARENIDTNLATCSADAVWVLDPDCRLVYSANTCFPHRSMELPFPAERLPALFMKSRTCQFYAETSLGFMKIYGATVHPTNDPQRRTDPRGYFLVGCLMDKVHTDAIARLTDASMIISPVDDRLTVSEKAVNDPSVIAFTDLLPGWNGKPLRRAVVSFNSQLLRDDLKARHDLLIFLLIFSLMILSSISLFMFLLVRRPLKRNMRSRAKRDR